jgi:hypothetical protein
LFAMPMLLGVTTSFPSLCLCCVRHPGTGQLNPGRRQPGICQWGIQSGLPGMPPPFGAALMMCSCSASEKAGHCCGLSRGHEAA